MEKMIKVVLGLILAVIVTGTCIAADNPAQKKQPQAVCPVMGGKTNKNLSVDYNGQQVYFCCPPCREAFKKDPEKYLKKSQ